MAPNERAARAAGLDGLRGLAALAVFAVHIWIYTEPSRPARDGFWDLLVFEFRLSVILFFALSGFLLFRHFARAAIRGGEPVDLGGYAKRRLTRVLPAYYVAMIGTFALLWGATSTPGVRLVDADEVALFALFAQNYSEDTLIRFNPVTWTLCLEVAFYALLPLIGLAAHRLRTPRRQALLLGGAITAGIAWNGLVHVAGWNSVAAKALPAYLPYFALGMLLALLIEARLHGAGRRPSLGPAATAALAGGGLALVVLDGWWHAMAGANPDRLLIGVFTDLPAGVGFAAMIAASVLGRGAGVAWMRLPPFVWTGLVSYGFYLWHVPLILFLKRLGLLPGDFVAAAAVALPLSLAIAAASWYLLERPLIRRVARATRRVPEPMPARAPLEARTAP